jgi:hypothetical protein
VWQRQLLKHRFRAPAGGEFKSFGTEKELAELEKAQAMYPERHMYLGAGSKYSPWYGQRWGHYVATSFCDMALTRRLNLSQTKMARRPDSDHQVI